jgi:hypothetical protein
MACPRLLDIAPTFGAKQYQKLTAIALGLITSAFPVPAQVRMLCLQAEALVAAIVLCLDRLVSVAGEMGRGRLRKLPAKITGTHHNGPKNWKNRQN